MIWTGWNNSGHHSTGAGYGVKITAVDRDRHFKRTWRTVSIELPTVSGLITAKANTDKKSFWQRQCGELISRDMGRWMLDEGYAPWPTRVPPKFDVESVGSGRFRLNRRVTV